MYNVEGTQEGISEPRWHLPNVGVTQGTTEKSGVLPVKWGSMADVLGTASLLPGGHFKR